MRPLIPLALFPIMDAAVAVAGLDGKVWWAQVQFLASDQLQGREAGSPGFEAIKRGEAALEQGEFLTHEQVGDRLRRFLKP